MKNRKLIISIGICVLFSCFVVISGFSQEDVMKVADSAFGVRLRPSVKFLHEDHNEKAGIDDCAECHHVWENGKKLEDESSEDMECSECHMKNGKGRMDLIKAYHDNCKGCHEESKKGPIMCGECHRKAAVPDDKS